MTKLGMFLLAIVGLISCANDNLSPITTYRELAEKYRAPTLRGPFNFDAREQAGFTAEELELLESLSEKRTQVA